MRIQTTLDKTVPMKVRYNGVEIFSKVLEPGDHDIEVETPKETGTAELFGVFDGEEVLIATASYTF